MFGIRKDMRHLQARLDLLQGEIDKLKKRDDGPITALKADVDHLTKNVLPGIEARIAELYELLDGSEAGNATTKRVLGDRINALGMRLDSIAKRFELHEKAIGDLVGK